MSIIKVLSGHYSPETAYLVLDYPYGFRMRCQIRYWLEVNSKGTRFWSQTSNPKKGDVWNKPKSSTYSMAGAMYLDEKDHVQWDGFSAYYMDMCRDFLAKFETGMTDGEKNLLTKLAEAHEKRQAQLIPIT